MGPVIAALELSRSTLQLLRRSYALYMAVKLPHASFRQNDFLVIVENPTRTSKSTPTPTFSARTHERR